MHDLAFNIITQAASAAGLPAGRVMMLSAGDNLTLPRPRVELEFLPESYTRTGRKLAISRAGDVQTTKKELYEVRLDLTANAYAADEAWLAAFCLAFVAAFPRGVNDTRGNWVKIRVEQATFTTPPAKRVGEKEIKVFTKVNTLFALCFIWRVTKEEQEQLIKTIEIKAPKTGL